MTIDEWVEALGGNRVVAALFGVGQSAVSNWRSWNKLPPSRHLRALRISAERGIAFDPERVSRKRARAA